jgi:hypothetical protein
MRRSSASIIHSSASRVRLPWISHYGCNPTPSLERQAFSRNTVGSVRLSSSCTARVTGL